MIDPPDTSRIRHYVTLAIEEYRKDTVLVGRAYSCGALLEMAHAECRDLPSHETITRGYALVSAMRSALLALLCYEQGKLEQRAFADHIEVLCNPPKRARRAKESTK